MCLHVRTENALPNCILPLAKLRVQRRRLRNLQDGWLLNPREQRKLIVAEIT